MITNRTIPSNEKQVALIILNRHGQEKGCRVVAPEIIQYLASEDARQLETVSWSLLSQF